MRSTWSSCRWLLLAGGLGLGGCPTPPEPLVDLGDRVDTGRFAACTYTHGPQACGALESYDVSGCEPASLGQVDPEGLFTLQLRSDSEVPAFGPSSLRLSSDGTQDYFRGGSPDERQVGGGTLYLSRTVSSAARTTRYSMVGCRAEPGKLYGCYATCRDGKLLTTGTFQAWRWTRRAGEAEASGLQLASEAPVAQGEPVDVYVTQGHAYVVSLRTASQLGALSVFDVSDKAAPVLKKTISLDTDGSGSYWNGVWAKGNALYVASGALGVIVFDISQPADPQLVLTTPQEPNINVHTVFVEGDRLYAMSPGPVPSTLIFDVSTPLSPVLLGRYATPAVVAGTPGAGYPHDAFAFEGRLYINHWFQGYLIVDVRDPENGVELGRYHYTDATSHASAVGRFGERLIAFEGGENWGAHLRVLDVTDPTYPRLIGRYKLEPNASIHNMVLKGQRLYVAHYQHGVRVLDVSEPEQPREVVYYNTYRESDPARGQSFYEGAIGIRVPGDGYVYVVDTSRGLLLFPEP